MSKAAKNEKGYTVVELALTIIILAIIMATVTVSWNNTRKRMALKSGADEVETAIQRSIAICMQEGVDVYLQFWNDSSPTHPNQYTIYRVYPDGTSEADTDEPTEPPIPGSGYTTDGSEHYWFKLAEGKVQVVTSITLFFQRQGTLIRVTGPGGGTQWTITVSMSDEQRSVAVNETGEIVAPE